MGNDLTVPSSRQAVPPARGNEAIDFIHSLGRDAIHTLEVIGILRCTAAFLSQIDFSAAVLRNRPGRCLAAKQLDGTIAFDLQLETKLVLKAIWLVDTQQWTEVANALKVARQHGFCQLPITLAVADLERHDSKQAYLADARVIALWKMVGRHVNFGGQLGRFELFDQPSGGVRAIKDEPGFELDINPPLPPAHPYRTHTINDNPPVRSTIHPQGDSWTTGGEVLTQASTSAFIMRIIMVPSAANLGWTPWVAVNRHAHGGVLDGLMNNSPHQPPDRCTAVVAGRGDDRDPPVEYRILLPTAFDGPFVASIILSTSANTNTVFVSALTNEPPVGNASDAFKDRRPATAPLVGGPLGSTIADMVVNQQEESIEEDGDGEGEAAPAIVSTDEAKQRLDEAETCKHQGNTSFQSRQCEDALRHYTKAARLLAFAACYLELKNYAMTIRRCTEVLAVDPHLVKALYRRARAHLECKDFGEAKRDVIRALDIAPNDTELSKLLREIKKIQADEEAKERRKLKSRIGRQGGGWTAGGEVLTQASTSAFVMRVILLPPVANVGRTPWLYGNRHAHGGVLDGLLNQSPHQPPHRCTAVVASRWDDTDPPVEVRILLLTPFDSPFVAWITLIITQANTTTVAVSIVTNEPPVGDASDAFKDRRPATAPLVGGPLGSTIADMAVNQQEEASDEEEGADDDDGDEGEDKDGDSEEDEWDDIDGEGEAKQRLDEAEACKGQGNTSFQSRQCEDALRHYTKAARLLAFVAPSPAIEEERHRLATLCKLNEVLAVDPHLVKALYRRARAHLECKDFGEAKRNVIRALDIAPNDTELSKLLREVKKMQADEEAKERRKFKAFFEAEVKRSDHSEAAAATAPPSVQHHDDIDDGGPLVELTNTDVDGELREEWDDSRPVAAAADDG
ncbi:unnamed protein product [Vitrella brassicaformis CCMP3155]|uniref:Uncharacterized protein n=1 Tax=Vitrella brassicaformis (strain CCMP3155) TaxID=1169540 RepID=A0A0G4EMP0_VITBC|nr:unnamed protein product [Vitrella brassicaformis CCMP3155]|eukprot:CEL98440.1 unnamed protein product [Vitrella brassicaformis CCMP3155]